VGAEVDDEQLRIGLIVSDGVTRQITTVQLIIGRMVKDVLFSSGGIDRRDEILVLIDLRTDLIGQAAIMSSASGDYAHLPGIEESAELTHRIDDQVLFAIGANQVDINLMVDTLGNADQQPYYAYQDAVQDLVNDRADELEAGSLRRQRIMTALASVTLAVAIAVVVAVSRSITRPLISLTQQARSLATERLPGAVHEVLATPSGSDVHMPELLPVEVRSTDEVARWPRPSTPCRARPWAWPSSRPCCAATSPTRWSTWAGATRTCWPASSTSSPSSKPTRPTRRCSRACSASTTWPPGCDATPRASWCSPSSTRPATGPPRCRCWP
jgi:hypothetical protein